jgi:D-alanine-D-alanine ligase-like ATP-grasp enzyme
VFGAVDVITRRDQHYILEVNTAAGLGGPTTLEAYTNAIRRYLNGL